jgi:uroporphyrinogen-III synthase
MTAQQPPSSTPAHFGHCQVLALESRRAAEMQLLIERFSGVATVAPAMREVPLATQPVLRAFVEAIAHPDPTTQHDLVCMTGVGTRLLLRQLETVGGELGLDAVQALKNLNIILRSAKSIPVLRDHGLSGTLVNEPHTWQQVLMHYQHQSLAGREVWIAEFGDVAPLAFVAALSEAGASVKQLPIYRWALPEDTEPLQTAMAGLIAGQFHWLLLTSGVQLWHLMELARELGQDTALRQALAHIRIASIGPVCSEAVRELDLTPILEAKPHKMGILVQQAAAWPQ